MAEDSQAGTHAVAAERSMAATPERVWAALADPAHLAGWFVDGARREGDRYFWRWEDFGTFDVRVLHEAPGEWLVLEGPGMAGTPHRTEVRIRQEGGATVVHIVESGFSGPPEEDDEARGIRSGWAMALALLELYVTEHWDERRHAFFTLRPASVDWDTILPWFTEPERLAQWLGTAGAAPPGPARAYGTAGPSGTPATAESANAPLRTGGRVALAVGGGPAVSGRVLGISDTEVVLAWEEGNGALELKAFAGPAEQRFVALRGTHWGETRDFRGLEDAVEEALDRLVGLLAG